MEKELGLIIQQFYDEHDYNDYDLACISGLSVQAICYYRLGKRKPKFEAIKPLCEALNITPNQLLGWKEK